MLAGAFTPADLRDVTGLSRSSVYELTRALRSERLLEEIGDKAIDAQGRRSIQRFRLARSSS